MSLDKMNNTELGIKSFGSTGFRIPSGLTQNKVDLYNATDLGLGTSTSQNGKVNQNKVITDMFRNTKGFKDVTKYKLMRGVPDFGSLVQFNPYESGYAIFLICQMPKFIERLAKVNTYYRSLMLNWEHIIEYEFKSFDGLEDMGADTIQLGDDLNNLNVISKVNMQSATEFSLTYDEKSGSPLTKFAHLYLSGIKDPRTQVKNYHGLIHSGDMEPGFENEVFTFLFIATDNTMREVEAAYLLLACQLNSAEFTMYNFTKGDINKKDITVKFSGYPVRSAYVDMAAKDLLQYLVLDDRAGARQIVINSNNYKYTGLKSVTNTLKGYNASSVDGINADEFKKSYQSLNLEEEQVVYSSEDFYVSTNGSAYGLTPGNFKEVPASPGKEHIGTTTGSHVVNTKKE